MRTADHRCVTELARSFGDGVLERGRGREDAVERTRHLERQGSVDDVARREAVVHPRRGGHAHTFLYDVDELGVVVVRHLLAFVDRGDIEAGSFAHRARVVRRYDTESRPSVDHEHLDLEPGAEARFVGEQLGDLGERVPGEHVRAWAAMSRR